MNMKKHIQQWIKEHPEHPDSKFLKEQERVQKENSIDFKLVATAFENYHLRTEGKF